MEFNANAFCASSNPFASFSKIFVAVLCISIHTEMQVSPHKLMNPREQLFLESAITEATVGGIIIVMEDDILFADTGDPEDNMDKIVISLNGNIVHVETSCGRQNCSTNVGHLEPGIYLAEAYTEGGASSSREIALN